MKILYLTPRVPYPPTKGEKIRAFHYLTQLARRHEVHLASLADTREDLDHAAELRTFCRSVELTYWGPSTGRLLALGALATGRSLSVAAFDSPGFHGTVRRLMDSARPDVLVAYSTAMAPYVERVARVPRVVDFVDADSEKWRAYGQVRSFPQSTVYALEGRRLAAYEGRVAAAVEASVFVSEMEAAIVRPRAAGHRIEVLPNGVDLETFRPAPATARRGAPSIVFTGVMDYFPNEDAVASFANDIFPTVRAAVPEAVFTIVGRNPSPAVSRLAALPGVVVTGTVPDVRPYLADATLAVAPFRIARGVQNKVLEAMASGLPVVGTPVAFQSMVARDEDGVFAASTPDAFASAVVALLRDDDLRRERGQGARRYVERHHRWDELGTRFEAILMSVVTAAPNCAPHAPPARLRANDGQD